MSECKETTVLLVEADPDERERMGSLLERAGYGVITCTGPTAPDYTCVGDRTGHCPLAVAASVLVLDMNTNGDALMIGTASEDLLGLYLFEGARVVALGSHRSDEIPRQLLRRRRHPSQEDLLEAVRSLASDGETSARRDDRSPP